ncbi:DUF1365 domain-containing protein [Sneathiella aquimaris]|uniref:DUF1365 domain-containing protein n=1 Tax=Sneathiella aquimaris TaxID=2599305 RepID=UPI00146EB338|nr:DUF1365 domain-containing protein [Sneathiella aquimaris]
MLKSSLYQGIVTHRRLKPVGHLLQYRLFYLLIDLDEFDLLDKSLSFLSVGKKNICSLYQSDFGENNPADLKAYILGKLQAEGIETPISRISLLCVPRLFGYAFNPISVYYCYGAENTVVAVVYEVRNTFGEQHTYVFSVTDSYPQKILKHYCAKKFYVSPFMPMDCQYNFSLLPPSDEIAVSIRQFHEGSPIMNASFHGTRSELTSRTLGQALLKFPFNSLKVITGIHWEALKLWLKGLKVVDRFDTPTKEMQEK